MEIIFLLIIYPLILIAQIAFLAVAIMKKRNSNWISLFIFDVLSILSATYLGIYYGRAPGQIYIADIGTSVMSYVASLVFLFVTFISVCVKVVMFELNLRKNNKNYVSPVCLILASCFIFSGILMSGYEFVNNIDIKKTEGTVIEVSKDDDDWFEFTKETIEYEIDGKIYKDKIINNTDEVGDIITVYYNPAHNLVYKADVKILYIPAYLFGILIVIFRFKDGIDKKEELIDDKNIKSKKSK